MQPMDIILQSIVSIFKCSSKWDASNLVVETCLEVQMLIKIAYILCGWPLGTRSSLGMYYKKGELMGEVNIFCVSTTMRQLITCLWFSLMLSKFGRSWKDAQGLEGDEVVNLLRA
jgi:hypothetical protein